MSYKICKYAVCTKKSKKQKQKKNKTKQIKTKTKNKKSMKAGCDIKCTTVLIKINAKLCV